MDKKISIRLNQLKSGVSIMKFIVLLLSYTLISMNAVAEDINAVAEEMNSEQLFTWAESKCPTYFPSIGATSGTTDLDVC